MKYALFESTEGTIKVYTDCNGYAYYLDINNEYDESFQSESEYKKYMKSVKAKFIGYDYD